MASGAGSKTREQQQPCRTCRHSHDGSAVRRASPQELALRALQPRQLRQHERVLPTWAVQRRASDVCSWACTTRARVAVLVGCSTQAASPTNRHTKQKPWDVTGVTNLVCRSSAAQRKAAPLGAQAHLCRDGESRGAGRAGLLWCRRRMQHAAWATTVSGGAGAPGHPLKGSTQTHVGGAPTALAAQLMRGSLVQVGGVVAGPQAGQVQGHCARPPG